MLAAIERANCIFWPTSTHRSLRGKQPSQSPFLNRTKDEYFTRGLVEDCTLKFLGAAAWTAVERIGSKGKPTHSRRSTQKPQSAQNSFLFCEFSESRVECRLKSFECVQNRPANFWRARPSTSLRTGALVGLP